MVNEEAYPNLSKVLYENGITKHVKTNWKFIVGICLYYLQNKCITYSHNTHCIAYAYIHVSFRHQAKVKAIVHSFCQIGYLTCKRERIIKLIQVYLHCQYISTSIIQK